MCPGGRGNPFDGPEVAVSGTNGGSAVINWTVPATDEGLACKCLSSIFVFIDAMKDTR